MNELRRKLYNLHPYWVRARNIWCEARREPWDGQVAVDWVVKNRAADERWPDGLGDVILQRSQFSWTLSNDAGYYMAFSPWAFDLDSWKEAKKVIEAVDNGTPDPTNSATHYLNVDVTRRHWGLPAWYDPDKITAEIGRHTFLKL